MKRCMVFKLGRRLVQAWRRIFRRRRRYQYIRLGAQRSQQVQTNNNSQPITKKLASWSRWLALPLLRHRDRQDPKAPLLGATGGARDCRPPPKGYLAVYVAGEKEGGASPVQRYLVPVMYFNHPLFGELLRESEKKNGFHHPGVITIPCAASEFERVRSSIAAGVGGGGGGGDRYCRRSPGWDEHCSVESRALFL